LRLATVSIYPFMPDTSEKMWKQLGLKSLLDEAEKSRSIYEWNWSPGYEIRVLKGDPLFPRIEVKKKDEKEKKGNEKPVTKDANATEAGDNLISINDFTKVQLKIGIVLQAERVAKSNKLVKLQVDTGENRQIVAGIGKSYAPEDLVGKKIVVLTNLQPAKLMGVESQGMLLAAMDSEGVLSILTPEKEVKQGALIR
jgi:methionyl-tRNA synthetase